jgi:hypothetical protein
MAVLREAFAGAPPDAILWRQKEQFSDGVGYGWIDRLRAHAEQQVSDREFAAAGARYPVNTPATREACFYRRIFELNFPGVACAATVPGGRSIACSSPAALNWDPAFAGAADPPAMRCAACTTPHGLTGLLFLSTFPGVCGARHLTGTAHDRNQSDPRADHGPSGPGRVA